MCGIGIEESLGSSRISVARAEGGSSWLALLAFLGSAGRQLQEHKNGFYLAYIALLSRHS